MKSYAELDRAPLQFIDVTKGTDSTLTVLGQKLGDGVTVVRDYEPDLPRIEAYPRRAQLGVDEHHRQGR